jgi:hypothetical protein
MGALTTTILSKGPTSGAIFGSSNVAICIPLVLLAGRITNECLFFFAFPIIAGISDSLADRICDASGYSLNEEPGKVSSIMLALSTGIFAMGCFTYLGIKRCRSRESVHPENIQPIPELAPPQIELDIIPA